MNIVNVAKLKANLSSYLKRVTEGEEVVITSYRRAVARIVPPDYRKQDVLKPKRPVTDIRKAKGIRRKISGSAVDFLIQDRQAR